MIYIAHRGLLNGPDKWENSSWLLDEAIRECGNAECDIRVLNDGSMWLGHDKPTYEVDYKWLWEHGHELWIHCKNIKALEYFHPWCTRFHYFWHEEDTVTLTSRGYIWAYPGKQPIVGSIAVLPELYDDSISQCVGICSDYYNRWRGL